MSAQGGNAIEIAGLGIARGGGPVLAGVSLTVRRHEILGVLGRCGAGKTTLLQAVADLVPTQAGAIRVFGEAPTASRARLAYLPERFQAPGHLSGDEFVRLTLAFHGCQMRRARIAVLAEEIDLDPSALTRPIRSYAKGMAQKLGLLTMLATDLPLLVLDEPMSGLDPKARLVVKRHLTAYRARGHAILLGSEMPADHDGLCDRIAILDRGRLVDVGSAEELQARHGAPTLQSAFLAAIERTCLLPASAS